MPYSPTNPAAPALGGVIWTLDPFAAAVKSKPDWISTTIGGTTNSSATIIRITVMPSAGQTRALA